MADSVGGDPSPPGYASGGIPPSFGPVLGAATWFDGTSSRRHAVSMHARQDAANGVSLALVENDAVLATIAFADLRRLPGPARRVVLQPINAPPLARLEITDSRVAAALLPLCPALSGPGANREAGALRIVGWSLAAAASLALAVFGLIPLLAQKMVPFVPDGVEERLGRVAEQQMKAVFRASTCKNESGVDALVVLASRLRNAAPGLGDVSVEVWDSSVPNAFALPGARIRLFKGLLDKAQSADEFAGVLAHEMGHVIHRDSLRELLRSSASGYTIGILFGDVAGAGVLLGAGSYLVDASFTREAETKADDEAMLRLDALGRPAKPMGDLLARITGSFGDSMPAFLSTHPATPERAARLGERAQASRPPLLDETQWKALREICKTK